MSGCKFKNAATLLIFKGFNLILEVSIDFLHIIAFFGFPLISYSNRFDLVLYGFIVEFDGFHFALHLPNLFLESKALFLEEAELGSQLNDIFVPFDFYIDVSVGLLSQYQIVAHFL